MSAKRNLAGRRVHFETEAELASSQAAFLMRDPANSQETAEFLNTQTSWGLIRTSRRGHSSACPWLNRRTSMPTGSAAARTRHWASENSPTAGSNLDREQCRLEWSSAQMSKK